MKTFSTNANKYFHEIQINEKMSLKLYNVFQPIQERLQIIHFVNYYNYFYCYFTFTFPTNCCYFTELLYIQEKLTNIPIRREFKQQVNVTFIRIKYNNSLNK